MPTGQTIVGAEYYDASDGGFISTASQGTHTMDELIRGEHITNPFSTNKAANGTVYGSHGGSSNHFTTQGVAISCTNTYSLPITEIENIGGSDIERNRWIWAKAYVGHRNSGHTSTGRGVTAHLTVLGLNL